MVGRGAVDDCVEVDVDEWVVEVEERRGGGDGVRHGLWKFLEGWEVSVGWGYLWYWRN